MTSLVLYWENMDIAIQLLIPHLGLISAQYRCWSLFTRQHHWAEQTSVPQVTSEGDECFRGSLGCEEFSWSCNSFYFFSWMVWGFLVWLWRFNVAWGWPSAPASTSWLLGCSSVTTHTFTQYGIEPRALCMQVLYHLCHSSPELNLSLEVSILI